MRGRCFNVAAACDAGCVKEINQDHILIKIGADGAGVLGMFAVADGMGGLEAGEVASKNAIQCLSDWWSRTLLELVGENEGTDIEVIGNSLDKCLLRCNEDIITYGKQMQLKLGTTISILFIYRDKLIIKHVGDSRIYRLGRNLIQLTEDHSWVGIQVKMGRLSSRDAKRHPRRNILTQCLGIDHDIDIFTRRESTIRDNTYLVCSDGFYCLLEDREVLIEIHENKRDERALKESIDRLVSKAKERGERDNLSAIVVYSHKTVNKESLLFKIYSAMEKLVGVHGR